MCFVILAYFIIYNNTGKDLTRKTLAHPFFHNNSYKTTYTSFILCLSGTSEIEIDSINYSTKENTLLMMVPNLIIKYNEIIGKIICVNEKAGIPDVYVGMSFYHS